VHATAPVTPLYAPGAQAVHPAEPVVSALYEPAAQPAHAGAPAAL
jgi:hypothetical protein